MDGRPVNIPVGDLHESPTNPRRRFDAAKLEELASSIRRHGVLEPIIVRKRDGGGYEIVAGARRARAAKLAALLDVPAIVKQLTDEQALEVAFIENLQRENLHPLEEGEALKALHDTHGKKVHELAALVDKSESYVWTRIKLAELPPKAQTLLLEEKITLSHAILLTTIPVPALADEAAAGIAKGNFVAQPMTQKDAVEYVRRNFQCDLRQAAFDTRVDQLVAGVGPCAKCPKRSGNMKTLFGAADGGDRQRADICTDPKCFDAKCDAEFRLRAADVEARGGKVLEGKAADRAQHQSNDYVDVDAICADDPKGRTWRKLVGERAVSCLPTVLGRATSGHTFTRVAKKELDAAVEASGKLEVAKKLKDAEGDGGTARAQETAKAKRHRTRLALARELMPRVVEGVATASALRGVLMLVLEQVASRHQSWAKVCERRELHSGLGYGRALTSECRDALAKLSPEGLQGLIVEVIASDRPAVSFGDDWSAAFRAAAELASIDLKKELAAATKTKASKAAPVKKRRRARAPAKVAS